jgi:aldose 1-epimerase
MNIRGFGSLGRTPVEEIALRSDTGAEAKIISYGAAVRDLVVPRRDGAPQRVVLGLERLEDYVAHSPYFGAIVGRYANRIAGGAFRIGERLHRLSINEAPNHLHGGVAGFSKCVWQVAGGGASWVALTLFSPDGDQGYPGNLTATCVYRLEESTLRIELSAVADAVTPVNLCHHSYFNLDGAPNILDHNLELAADFYAPVDDKLIPTGEIRAVRGGAYDFRAPRPVRCMGTDASAFRYDINVVLRRDRVAPSPLPGPPVAYAGMLGSAVSGVTLEVWTSEPGLQFYDGHLLDLPVAGLDGRRYGPYAGLCLEPQHFPDSPNHPYFPETLLRPDEVYRQTTEYRFSAKPR